jgi:hypothetical protein
MIKSQKDMLRTHGSLISRSPLEWGSTCQSNGLKGLTMAISPATWLMMACETLHTLYPSMHPCYHQMICQLDLFCGGSVASSLDHMPSSYKWLRVHGKWMIGESQLTSSDTVSTMKNTRKSTQKFTNSSWMPLLLSKIVPYVSNGLKHLGVLKVLLTSKGWVPSPPVPSGAHASRVMKMTMKRGPVLATIVEDCDSEEEVMNQP